MKVFFPSHLVGIVALLLETAVSAFAAPGTPLMTVTLDPEENGKVTYMRVASETPADPADGLFGLTVNLANSGANDEKLTNVQVRFTYPNNTSFTRQFARNVTIKAGNSSSTYLKHDELVILPAAAPASVQVSLAFADYDRSIVLNRLLVPYDPPVPGGMYVFPADEADLGSGFYFTGSSHEAGAAGSQFLGYDLKVVDAAGHTVRPGGDSRTNEDYYGWGMPMRAIADGTVLTVASGFEDNPSGRRRFQEMAHHDGEAIADAKVTRLTDTRVATALRLPSGTLKLAIWDLADHGRQIHARGILEGEKIEDLALVALETNRFVTAVRLAGGNFRVIVWDVSIAGEVTRYSAADDRVGNVPQQAREVSIVKLTSSRFATATRTQTDSLRVIVFDVEDLGAAPSVHGVGTAGTCSSVSLVMLTASRVVTSLRNSSDQLQVTVWDVFEEGRELVKNQRSVSATDVLITRVVSVPNLAQKWVTAVGTKAKELKLIRWTVDENATLITRDFETTGESIQDADLAICVSSYTGETRFKNDFVTSFITPGGTQRYIGWSDDPDKPVEFLNSTDADSVMANQLSVDATGLLEFVGVVRNAAGNLRLTTWYWAHGGGNCLTILHGNCIVLYAHFRNGSLNPDIAFVGAPVAAGQVLARMGNSGAAGGPHTHIHSERIPDGLSFWEIVALIEADALSSPGPRPVPFYCARARRLDTIIAGGDSENTYAAMNGHGTYATGDEPHYFPSMAIRPGRKVFFVDKTSPCLFPNGQRECGFPIATGGPYPTVAQALNACCWGNQLHIRSGSYNEAVTFSTSMTVQSYDGIAVIGQ